MIKECDTIKNYKMILSYDGTPYDGWQKQGNTPNTIQAKLERILSEVSKALNGSNKAEQGAEIELHGSGRTDAGTHALGQVANFHMNFEGTISDLQKEIEKHLPETIALLSLEEVGERFHSRLSAKRKKYTYTIWTSSQSPVFERKYVFWCKEALDLELMQEGAKCFLGKHDFKSFCANQKMKKSTIREIYDISFCVSEHKIEITVEGNGFLYQMVRIMMGTLIEIGEGKKKVSDIEEILNARIRERAGFTAPAKGLCLKEVFYD